MPAVEPVPEQLRSLDAARWRMAVGLTVAMTVIYVGFIVLIAYAKAFLGTVLVPGLSMGILLGVVVILAAWALIVVYVRWANRHYDPAIAAFRREAGSR